MTLTILLKYSSGGEAVFVGLLQGLLIAGVLGLYYWIKGKKKQKKEEDISESPTNNGVIDKKEKVPNSFKPPTQQEDADNVISQKLLQLVIELSELTSDLSIDKNKKAISCESNMLFFILMWLVLAEETTDNSEISTLFVQNLPDFEDYINDEYADLFRHYVIDTDKYFSNRIDLYRDEIRKYTQNSSYAFPKITAAFYRTPLKINLEDYLGIENMFISSYIPIWKDAMREPIKILLAYKSHNK